MSKFLRFIGYATIVCSIILGIYYGTTRDPLLEALNIDEAEFRWTLAVYWWISGIIGGVLFIAFSKALDYLEENNYFLRELINRTNPNKETNKNDAYAGYSEEALRMLREAKPAMNKLEGYTFKAND